MRSYAGETLQAIKSSTVQIKSLIVHSGPSSPKLLLNFHIDDNPRAGPHCASADAADAADATAGRLSGCCNVVYIHICLCLTRSGHRRTT